jgi:hypothetical protein
MFKIPITNPWSCLPTAFAIACDIPFGVLIHEIGHDGSKCPYQNPRFHAGFHVQECIEAIQKFGWAGTPVELFPQITPDYSEIRTIYFVDEAGNWARFLRHLTQCKNGVIEGIRKNKIGHSVAWDGKHIYDPTGKIYSFSEHPQFNFFPRILWKLTRMEASNET